MAQYFSYFPQITYSLDSSYVGTSDIVTNIFRRSAFIEALKTDVKIFYPYTIGDGDTPEIIAHKLYKNVHLYWIVTLFNDIIDPVMDWPKPYRQFESYIASKYGSTNIAKNTTELYIKTIKKVNSFGIETEQDFQIDLTTYNSLSSVVPQTYQFTNGSTVTITTTRATVSAYDYESQVNEAKRLINLLKIEYVPTVIRELETLRR